MDCSRRLGRVRGCNTCAATRVVTGMTIKATAGVAMVILVAVLCGAAGGGGSEPIGLEVETGHGRLHFAVRPGDGPVGVVLEAGGAADSSSWGEVPARLSRQLGVTVVSRDRAGLGGSEPGPTDLTPWQEVADLERALDALNLHRVVLVGHSYGGLLALLAAERDPDRIAGLVLVDPMNPAFVAAVGLGWVQATVPDIADPATPREHVIVRMKATFSELLDRTAAGLPAVHAPMVVITAGEPWWDDEQADAAWRRSHEELAKGADRRLVVATGCAHDIPGERPGLVVNAVAGLVAGGNQPELARATG